MQKIYVLLRNNKQSGPHTLEELVMFQLRPMDLIWIEGKSTGWKYPTEIEELAGSVKTEETIESKTGYVEANPDLVLPKTSPKKQEQKKANNKAKVYVKLPSHYDLSREVSDALNEHIPPSPQEEVIRNKNDETLNTKYVRDLDDIREQYSEWIYQQNREKKPHISPRRIWIAAVVIILLATGFLAQMWTTPAKHTANEQLADRLTAKKPLVTEKNRSSKSRKTNRNTQKKNKKTEAANASGKPGDVKDKKKGMITKDSVEEETKHITPSASPSAHLFQEVDVTYSRDTSKSEGISGLRFSVHNRSDFKLNVIAINVFYHDGAHDLSKETIYFNNVMPAGSMTTAAPAHPKASSVTYRLALISTDENIFYGKD